MTPETIALMERVNSTLGVIAARCSNKLSAETFKQVLDSSVELTEAIRDAKAGRPIHMGLSNGN